MIAVIKSLEGTEIANFKLELNIVLGTPEEAIKALMLNETVLEAENPQLVKEIVKFITVALHKVKHEKTRIHESK